MSIIITRTSKIVPSAVGLAKNFTGESIIGLQKFLQKFGYLPVASDEAGRVIRMVSEAVFDDATETALLRYQKFYGLLQSGKLNETTVKQMVLPRCGVPGIN
jgi:hypothetical protein